MRQALFVVLMMSGLFAFAQSGFFTHSQSPNANSYQLIEPTKIVELQSGDYLISYWNKVGLGIRHSYFYQYNAQGIYKTTLNFPFFSRDIILGQMVELSNNALLISANGDINRETYTFSALVDTTFDTTWTTCKNDYSHNFYKKINALSDSSFLGILSSTRDGQTGENVTILKTNLDQSIVWEVPHDSLIDYFTTHNKSTLGFDVITISLFQDSCYVLISGNLASHVLSININTGKLGAIYDVPHGTFKIDMQSGKAICFHHNLPYQFDPDNLWKGKISIFDLGFNLEQVINPRNYLDSTEHIFEIGCAIDRLSKEVCLLYGIDDLLYQQFGEKNMSTIGVLRIDTGGILKQKAAMTRKGISIEPVDILISNDGSVVFATVGTINGGGGCHFVKVTRNQNYIGTDEYSIVGFRQMLLYPNPASQSTTLQLPTAIAPPPITINVYNLKGQKVKAIIYNGYSTQIEVPLQNMAAGVYVIELTQGSQVWREKLVVE